MPLSRSLESHKKTLSYQESLADAGSQEVGRAEDAVGPSAGASELGGRGSVEESCLEGNICLNVC